MKRSEMIEIIQERIDPEALYIVTEKAAKMIAEQALAIVEEAGMLPPSYEDFELGNWDSIVKNEWEPEK